jgi:hypothetical protein
MRRTLALLSILFVPYALLLAQDEKVNNNATPPPIVKPARDFIMLQLGYVNWIQKPDSVKTKPFNYMFNAYLCYDFPIKKSNFSFAAGLGISTSVVYLNQEVIDNTDTSVKYSSAARFLPDTVHYKHYKFGVTYLQAPFELRYFSDNLNRNKGFKAAVGLQIGTLLGSKTKGLTSVEGTNVKYKTDTKRYLSPWNFAATARVGWGNFSVFASYNLTNVYKDNEGPAITPASVGITLTGL